MAPKEDAPNTLDHDSASGGGIIAAGQEVVKQKRGGFVQWVFRRSGSGGQTKSSQKATPAAILEAKQPRPIVPSPIKPLSYMPNVPDSGAWVIPNKAVSTLAFA